MVFKKKNKKKKESIKIPKTVQQSIPYKYVYEDSGIIEIKEGIFSKSYIIQDINYQTSKREEQEDIFVKYCEALNSFDSSIDVQITVNNANINSEDFENHALIKYTGDKYDHLREEYNKMLESKISEGKNNIRREKYITISLEAESIDMAIPSFARVDSQVTSIFKRIGNSSATALTTMERLEILHNIYNIGQEEVFGMKSLIDNKDVTNFTFKHMKKQGLSTKDIIGPMSMEFKSDHFKIGEKYGRALFLDNLPTSLKDVVIDEMSSLNSNMLTSINIDPIDQDKAIKIVKRQILNIDSNIIEKQKKSIKNGYSADMLPHNLRLAKEEAEELMDDLTSKNQKMFLLTLVVVHFADTLEELNHHTGTLESIASKHVCNLKKLLWQQEAGLTSALPLAYNRLEVKRTLTTESAAIFMPFSSQELFDNKGMYYGLNHISKNLILYDRMAGENYNGFILGTSGSGKSFSAKREMLNVLLNTKDDVTVIDPEGEYIAMAEMLGGEVIKISSGSDVYINPLDMDSKYADKENPISLKSNFILSLLETVVGGQYGLTPSQTSIIDRAIKLIYEDYVVNFDQDKIPTLLDLQLLLESQSEREAKEIALALELYTKGSLNMFAKKTNVNVNSRFVVYDIKDIGSTMKTMAMLVVLDNIWNRMIENSRNKKNTWMYIDEIYLLFNNEVSADFLQQIYKRARKWNGVPTGITQNIEDILKSEKARTMLSNSTFIMMLNQAPLDKIQLAELLNISSTQLSFITNTGYGEGLIYTGKTIVPFIDKFPTDTKLFKAMSTKPGE